MKKIKYNLLWGLVACFMLAGCTPQEKKDGGGRSEDSISSAFWGGGKQSNGDDLATTHELVDVKISTKLDNEKVQYKGMTVYFNKRYRIPNCVAYELTATEIAQTDGPGAERRNNYQFNADPNVEGCPDWWEYKNTPYDRGHMAPAMDMRWSKKSMEECFYLTNICPQDHGLNDGEWRHMEEAIHSWARKYKQIYVMTGPVMTSDMEMTGKDNDIAVPSQFFKIVYAPKENKMIAFLFDNNNTTVSWRKHVTTVDEIERLTGYDFFATLPDNTENAQESKSNFNSWPYYQDRDFDNQGKGFRRNSRRN